jgi:hypothetical protein
VQLSSGVYGAGAVSPWWMYCLPHWPRRLWIPIFRTSNDSVRPKVKRAITVNHLVSGEIGAVRRSVAVIPEIGMTQEFLMIKQQTSILPISLAPRLSRSPPDTRSRPSTRKPLTAGFHTTASRDLCALIPSRSKNGSITKNQLNLVRCLQRRGLTIHHFTALSFNCASTLRCNLELSWWEIGITQSLRTM